MDEEFQYTNDIIRCIYEYPHAVPIRDLRVFFHKRVRSIHVLLRLHVD